MRVGDKVQFRPVLYGGKRTVTGRIVFIPKHGRYVRVRYTAVNFYGETVEHFESLQVAGGVPTDTEPETRGREK